MQTALSMSSVTNTFCAIFLGFLWYFHHKRFTSIWFWVTFMVLHAAAATLMVFRSTLSPFISIIVANVLLVIGLLFILIGLEKFLNKKRSYIHNIVLIVIFIAVHVYFTYFQPNLHIRIYNINAMMIILIFQCAWILFYKVPKDIKPFSKILGTFFGIYILIILARLIFQIFFPLETNDFLQSGVTDSIMVAMYAIITIGITFGLILLVNGQLSKDIIKSENSLKNTNESLKRSNRKINNILKDTIDTLTKVIETHDAYSKGHHKIVANIASEIAEELNLARSKIENIKTAALIHDIGKVNIPISVLSNQGELSDIEKKLIEQHPKAGYDIVKNIKVDNAIKDIILQHHEKLDGSGYPNGLKDKDIIFEAKILVVADMLGSMLIDKPYKKSKSDKEIIKELRKSSGTLYDKKVVDVALSLLKEKKFVT